MKYVDTLPAQLGEQDPAGFVRYAVEIMNSRERSAGLSNQVLIPVAPTIAPPGQLALKVEADGVLISWMGANVPAPPTGLTYRYRVRTESCRELTPTSRWLTSSLKPRAIISTKLCVGD